MNPRSATHYYRAEVVQYAAPLNEYDEPVGKGTLEVHVRTISVHHYTKCGVVLDEYTGTRRRFVNDKSVKKYAHPTVELALESLQERLRSMIRIYTARINKANEAIYLAEEMATNPAKFQRNVLDGLPQRYTISEHHVGFKGLLIV